MVYAYCRKNNNHSVQSIEDWAENNSIVIDEFVWDDDAKQKDSYDKRRLGTFLLPKMQKGDILIVSEVSCIGRSAIELQRIIDTNFAVKRIRLVCLSIKVDIDFEKITSSDSHMLEMLSFAAKLQKTIVHETTKAALATRRNTGVKLGAASEKYQRNLVSKSKEERVFFHKKQALTRGRRYIENPETQAFIRILQAIFNLDEDRSKWDWDIVTTKGTFKDKIFQRMEVYQKSEGLFPKWDLSKTNDRLSQQRLAAYIGSIRRSFMSYYSNKKYENMTLEDYIKYVSSIATKQPHVVSNSKSTKRRKKSTNDKQEEVVLDTSRLNKIEIDTKESQKILSDIFIDSEPTENVNLKVSGAVMAIMKMLFTKEVWSYEEVETICKKRKQMIGSVLEQINDYALSKVDDIVLEDDGDNIYMMTEYKDMLL
ncbi:MAG: recombinase family protein [Bacilli bacterium]|nr:recombinase family protein [Bacilli bacterium]